MQSKNQDGAPEITPDPERENCVKYSNILQYSPYDTEVWNSPFGDVVFKFFRGNYKEPDQVMVWEMPEGVTVIPNTHYLEEGEHDYFCIVEYEGS